MELVVGQLLSLAPVGKELIEVARNVAELRPSPQIPRLIREFLESGNVRIKAKGIDFLISKFNLLEVEGAGPDQAQLAYYSNPLTGEVFQVDFSGGGLAVEKLAERFEFTRSSEFNYFASLKAQIERSKIDWAHLFEAEGGKCLILTGLSEYMETNCWSIHCSCVWSVEPDGSEGADTVSIIGTASLSGQYFENANFHFALKDHRLKPMKCVPIDSVFEKIGKAIFKLRNRLNNKFLFNEVDLGDQWATSSTAGSGGSSRSSAVLGPVHTSSLVRKLRRALPVHKAKFDWNLARIQLMQNL